MMMIIIKSYEFRIWVCFGHYNGGNTMTAAYISNFGSSFLQFLLYSSISKCRYPRANKICFVVRAKKSVCTFKRFASCSAHFSPLPVLSASENLDVSGFFGDGKWLTTIQGH